MLLSSVKITPYVHGLGAFRQKLVYRFIKGLFPVGPMSAVRRIAAYKWFPATLTSTPSLLHRISMAWTWSAKLFQHLFSIWFPQLNITAKAIEVFIVGFNTGWNTWVSVRGIISNPSFFMTLVMGCRLIMPLSPLMLRVQISSGTL